MILGIDPGETTGLAIRLNNGDLALTMCRGKEQLWKLIGKLGKEDQVVVEDFVTAGRISKHGLYTVRLVGSVEAMCWLNDIPCQRQVPHFRNGYLGPALQMIKETVGIDHEHRHEKDALAHLLAHEGWTKKSGQQGKVFRDTIDNWLT